jgi:hypothetical protein
VARGLGTCATLLGKIVGHWILFVLNLRSQFTFLQLDLMEIMRVLIWTHLGDLPHCLGRCGAWVEVISKPCLHSAPVLPDSICPSPGPSCKAGQSQFLVQSQQLDLSPTLYPLWRHQHPAILLLTVLWVHWSARSEPWDSQSLQVQTSHLFSPYQPSPQEWILAFISLPRSFSSLRNKLFIGCCITKVWVSFVSHFNYPQDTSFLTFVLFYFPVSL